MFARGKTSAITCAWALALASACGHGAARDPEHGGAAPSSEPIGQLSLGAGDGLPAITAPAQLRAAMSTRGQPRIGAALDPITHMTWRQRDFGPDVIAEAVEAQSCLVGARACNGYPMKTSFTARHGVAFEHFWAMLMAGYIAELRQRFEVDAQEVHVSKQGGRPTLWPWRAR